VLIASENFSVVGACWMFLPLYLLVETYFCLKRFGKKFFFYFGSPSKQVILLTLEVQSKMQCPKVSFPMKWYRLL